MKKTDTKLSLAVPVLSNSCKALEDTGAIRARKGSTCVGIESSAQQPWPWPDELDAMIADSAFHKNLFENDFVRYLEVIIRPGDFVPVHTHRWPSVIYVRSTSDFIRRDGGGRVLFDSRKTGAPPKTPVVEWVAPLPPHSIENVGISEVHLLTVELKQGKA